MNDPDDHDELNDPGMPRAIALMLAPTFLILGLVLLTFGKTEGGFLSCLLSVIALVTGLLRRGRKDGKK